MGLGCQQLMVFLGFKSLGSRRAFIHRITFIFLFCFIHPFPILALFLRHLAFIPEFIAYTLINFIYTCSFFYIKNRSSAYILFSLTISILTQCLPQIWNKFTLIITPPNLGQIFLEPSSVDDALLQPKIR